MGSDSRFSFWLDGGRCVSSKGNATVGLFSLDAVYIIMNTASKTLLCQFLPGLGADDTAM